MLFRSPPITDPLKVTELVLKNLVYYMTKSPVIAMVWQGAHAVQIVRKLTGSTEPLMSDVGTIRGDFVLDSYSMTDTDQRAVRNLVHASGSVKEAHDEINHWFKKEELFNSNLFIDQITYGTDLGGILEA